MTSEDNPSTSPRDVPVAEGRSGDLGLLRRLIGVLEDHVAASNRPVVDLTSFARLEEVFRALPEDPVSEDELIGEIAAYLRHSVDTANPLFMNNHFGGLSVPALAAHVLIGVAHSSAHTFEAGPTAAVIERRVIQKLLDLAGLRGGDGVFVPGGSASNHLGILCAIMQADPTIRTRGLKADQFALVTSSHAHFSITRAAIALGLGSRSVVRIRVDSHGRMPPERLREALRRLRKIGRTPIVCATASTTVLGAFDPIRAIAPIAREHDAWLHVDAASGGAALFSATHRSLLDGIELADSITWDAHKTSGVPLTCSVLLVRCADILLKTCNAADSGYLFHSPTPHHDIARKTLQCGRSADALKLWLQWLSLGTSGLRAQIDRLFALATFAGNEVERRPDLELIFPVQSTNVCFRFTKGDLTRSDVDALNKAIRDDLHRSGEALFNYSRVDQGRIVLRMLFLNAAATEADVSKLLDLVERAAAALLGKRSAR